MATWRKDAFRTRKKAKGKTARGRLHVNACRAAEETETLIRDPDDEEELDSYAYVRMQQRNPPITQEAAALEREKLLDQIPAGLKIAFINDDALPRINFESWAKKGYLGRGATLKTLTFQKLLS